MNYSKNRIIKKITVFCIVLTLLLWMIPVSIIFGSSEEDLKAAYEEALTALETAKEEVSNAENDLESAQLTAVESGASLEAAKEELNIRNENYASAAPGVEKLKEKLTFAQAAADEANSFYERMKETGSEEEINIAKEVAEKANAELESALTEYNDANANLIALQNDLDGAKAEFEKAKSAADEANANLETLEQVLNEKNEKLNEALSEVEKAKAELEAYQAKIAENEESNVTDEENTGEALTDVETGVETLEENGTEEEIVNEAAQIEEGTIIEDESTTGAEVTEEVVIEESINTEIPEEGLSGEEVIQEGEEASSEIVEAEEIEEEVIEVASELVPEGETVGEEAAVEESGEVKIDISFSKDENGYVQAGQITTFSAAVEGIVPFQYFWDFGDGSSSASQSPQYAYGSDGNYTLSLTILDVDGNAYSKSVTVNVSDYNPATTEYWISSDAGDEGTGTIDNPASISTVLSHTVNGDTLYFLPGTYNTSVNLDGVGTGTEGLSINFIAYNDAIFDGQSTLDYAFYYSAPLSYLGFYNFIFINYLNGAIYINNEDVTNIDIVDNTFSSNGAAIDITMDSGLNIQNNIIVDNDAGVVISSDDASIEHNIIAFNEEGIVVDGTRSNITVDYNDVFGNGIDYQGIEAGENDISINPEFTDKDNLDFSLPDDSPLYENRIIRVTSTDKDDYAYGEQVIITGRGYDPYQNLIIQIVRPDGSTVKEIFITTDENGNFTYDKYYVDFIGKDYLIKITDVDKNLIEILSFTDCHVKFYKYGDTDGDDSYDTGEPMLKNVDFKVYKKIGGVYTYQETITTDSNGYFSYPLSTGNWYRFDEVYDNYDGYGGFYSEEIYASGDITRWIPNCPVDVFIKQTLPINSSTFTEDPDNGGLTDPVVWHFVLNQTGGNATPATLTVTFQNAGTVTVNASNINNNMQHFYVGTSSDDTLLSASATVNVPLCGANLVLSHVCHKGLITLNKTGLGSNDTAGFTLYNSSGAPVGGEKQVTGNGFVSWTGLGWDTYKIVETTTPAGYSPIADITGIVVGASQQIYSFDRENTKIYGEIKLTKSGLVGLATGDYAGFTLYYTNGVAFGTEQQLTGNGTVTWSNVPYGTGYYIKETHTPQGYNTLADITGIDITSQGEVKQFERTNTKIPGEITLNKTGLGSNDTAGFTLYNSSGSPVGGEKQVTGNGFVSWTGLGWDTYKIVETTTPAGYSPIADITGIVVGASQQIYSFDRENTKIYGEIKLTKSGLVGEDKVKFTLSGPNGYSQSYIVSAASPVATWINLEYGTYTLTETPDPSNIYYYTATVTPAGPYVIGDAVGESLIYIISVENVPQKGEIEIQKTDKDSGEKLEGSTFQLLKYSSPGEVISTITLGPGSGGYHKWINLDFGTYGIKETIAPPGYLLAPEFNFTLDKDHPKKSLLLEIADPRIPGEITLNKSGLDAKDTAGFTLYDSSGAPVGGEKTITGNGSVSWTDLSWDTYKIVETTTPAGYTPIADITGIVVNANQQSYSFDRVNTKITILGSITLNKSGLGSKDTAGFTLYNSSGAAVGGEKTVTGNGSVTWNNLPWDTYTIKETTTPAGYAPIANIKAIVVGATQKSYSFDRVNTKITILGSITLNKSGLNSTDTAGFTLYDSNGNAVGGEKRITGNGSVKWSNLKSGTYSIVETTVPSGYAPMANITGIVIGSKQQNYSFDRVNTGGGIEVLGISELPFTGMNPFIPITGISSIIIGAILVIISLLRRNKRNLESSNY